MSFQFFSMPSLTLRPYIVGGLMLGLAACGQTPVEISSETPSPEQPVSPETQVSEDNERDPDSPIISDVVTQPVILESKPLPDVNNLSGLDQRGIENVMGKADLVRRDGNVTVMLYESSTCVLEVILLEQANDTFVSERINTRTRDGNTTDKGLCLQSLLPDGASF